MVKGYFPYSYRRDPRVYGYRRFTKYMYWGNVSGFGIITSLRNSTLEPMRKGSRHNNRVGSRFSHINRRFL